MIGFDLRRGSGEAVGGMAQKNNAQNGHKIGIGRQLGIGAEIIRGIPEISFKLRKVIHLNFNSGNIPSATA
ncbi:MAG TPA: hypothetical protein VF988_11820 [Verrucomicrobiae bacterium]